MVVIFFTKHGEIGKFGSILILRIQLIFIFLRHFGLFWDCYIVYIVFMVCFEMKIDWKIDFQHKNQTQFHNHYNGGQILGYPQVDNTLRIYLFNMGCLLKKIKTLHTSGLASSPHS